MDDDDLRLGRSTKRCAVVLDLDGGLVLQSLPGEVEQVGVPSHLIAWNAIAEACRIAASPVIAATMCGTTPRIQPNAATMPALEPGDRPGADGVHRTGAGRGDHHEGGQQKGNAHRSNLHVRALIQHTLLAVFSTLAEWDAAVAKGAGSAERPATRRDRACAASGPATGRPKRNFQRSPLNPFGTCD